ncbi:Oidioi.mRNA.OKI2018_I69.PAR.g10863.t1.cds [Oikopleura dioica]|uniref:Oidioi.mRNA.OKI2018_I69.PAR.g10863.t1.cds n=1 Tax=Oikopleura dioica TaxID=34765 RepID=A0ABN7RTK8_OIKDI|nr:Oidioi.mRNA.OKI2018_I69.PAR.g10863.t1.cds [Oikopleura dioica]
MIRKIEKDFLKRRGKVRECFQCQGFTETMRTIHFPPKTRSYCTICAAGTALVPIREQTTDAKFICPKKKCKKTYKFVEFFNATCCEDPPPKEQTPFEQLKTLQDKLQMAQLMETAMTAQVERARKYLRECEDKQRKLANESTRIESEILLMTNEICKKNQPNTCKVCFENYNENDRRESTIPCGHRFCYSCLTQLYECGICRTGFNNNQIIKLF